jgi:hypothetical protein
MKKKHDNRPEIIKFLDNLVRAAAQSEADIPNVYRDVCIELLCSLGPEVMKKKLGEIAEGYGQKAPNIVMPTWEGNDIPF